PGVMNAGDVPILIGALSPGERHFNGLFENIRIWDKSLSQEEIDQLLAVVAKFHPGFNGDLKHVKVRTRFDFVIVAVAVERHAPVGLPG
ncbi:LamG domain-containing protein, partial [bacterium]|nr:LamG domain-containing protein [bacterium]